MFSVDRKLFLGRELVFRLRAAAGSSARVPRMNDQKNSPSAGDNVASLLFNLKILVDRHSRQSMVGLENLRLKPCTFRGV